MTPSRRRTSFRDSVLALGALLSATTFGCSGSDAGSSEPTTFAIVIENQSEDADVPSPIAPGVWATHAGGTPFFDEGSADRGQGLETLAEDGDPSTLIASSREVREVGGFDAASDAYDEGAAMPGESFQFELQAVPGDSLSLLAMLVESNDWFIGTPDAGVALFDGSTPITGEIEVHIWDAGTEVDQPLGAGSDQPLRQAGADSGEDEDGVVTRTELSAADYVRVTITPR